MIGTSFSPLDPGTGSQQRPDQGGNATPLQQAIQVLQLRIPHLYNAPSPLAATGGGSQAPIGFDPMDLIRRLMAMQSAPTAAPMSAPSPQPGGGGMAPASPMAPAAPLLPSGASASAPIVPVSPSFQYMPNPGGTATPPRPFTPSMGGAPGAGSRLR